jgi:hypothetical protein
MDTEKLHDWLQIVGLAAVVGSLIFVGLQLKQADDIAYAELSDSSVARGIEHRALIADHANTWQKACLGAELTAEEKVIAGTIYFNYVHANYNDWESYERTGVGGISGTQLTDNFAANIHRYPGFWSMVQSYSGWRELGVRTDSELGERYRLAIRERVQELQQLEPNPEADVMWCGLR